MNYRTERVNISIEKEKKKEYESMVESLGIKLSVYVRILILSNQEIGNIYQNKTLLDDRLSVFLTPDEKDILIQKSNQRNVSFSDYVRTLLENTYIEWEKSKENNTDEER